MRRRARVRQFILTCIVLALFGAIALWILMRTAPAWYAPPDPLDANVAAIADEFEYRIVEEMQKIRVGEAQFWVLRLNESQMNAWLAARLPRWIANRTSPQCPNELGTPQVRIEATEMSVAMPLSSGRAARVLVVHFTPRVENGLLRVEVNSIGMGRIGLPGEPLANLVEKLESVWPQSARDPQIQQGKDALSGRQAIEPILRLEDGRRIRIVGMVLADGEIKITAQTLPP